MLLQYLDQVPFLVIWGPTQACDLACLGWSTGALTPWHPAKLPARERLVKQLQRYVAR